MDGVISGTATALGDTVAWAATSGVLFVVFAAIWLALGLAYVGRHASIDEAWRRIRGLNIALQALLWLLLLPVMLGIWIWERVGWPIVVRVVLVLGICGWNLLVLLPGSPA